MDEVMMDWSAIGRSSWTKKWFPLEKETTNRMADLLGADQSEITFASTLTVNLH